MVRVSVRARVSSSGGECGDEERVTCRVLGLELES